MDTLIIVCKAIVIAAGMTLSVMGAVAALLAFCPDMQDHPACKYEPQEKDNE